MCKRCHAAWGAGRRDIENRGRTSGSDRAGMERGARREGGERGGARLRPWVLSEPRDEAVEIDGRRDRHMLHVGLRQAPGPGPAEAKGAAPLGQRPFDAGSPWIELLA